MGQETRLHLVLASLVRNGVGLTEKSCTDNLRGVTAREPHRAGQGVRPVTVEGGQAHGVRVAALSLLRQHGDEQVGQLQAPSLASGWPQDSGCASAPVP
jgi:hypothetical protein